MYNVLLLHEMLESDCRIKDYLQLGNYNVEEKHLTEDEYESKLQHFDIILIESDKLETCLDVGRKVRDKTQVPIIVLSDRDEECEIIRLFQVGIDDYVVKPCWQGELMARIKARIERYRHLTKPFGVIKVNGLEINAFSRRVYLHGQEVELRLKEFEILLYLAQHIDVVVTKEELYEEVWKEALAGAFDNSVAVQVKKLREKIEPNINNPRYIETVWGIGYRFRS